VQDGIVKRIVVTGPAGAGKSRLAEELGTRLGIRVVHLDALYWKPGWVATPPAEWDAAQRRELETTEWIVDSQADDMLPDWLHAADTVVFVDASPLQCLRQVARRRLDRGASVGVPAAGPPGPLHRALLKFVRNQWRFRRRVRGDLLAELEREREGRRVVILRSRDDAVAFVSRLDSP
jgi:hypothetical protein